MAPEREDVHPDPLLRSILRSVSMFLLVPTESTATRGVLEVRRHKHGRCARIVPPTRLSRPCSAPSIYSPRRVGWTIKLPDGCETVTTMRSVHAREQLPSVWCTKNGPHRIHYLSCLAFKDEVTDVVVDVAAAALD